MQIKSIERVDIPDGEYIGRASGYHVVIPEFSESPIMLPIGIRGINVSCKVIVKYGHATINI